MKVMRKRHRLLNAIIDAVISRPDTVAYPFGELELPEGYRGAIVIDPEKCTGAAYACVTARQARSSLRRNHAMNLN
jgi:formate hydrogenlyase subunit 6/NADH:ubiquinone oxidoreductase subunit I